MTSRQEAIFRAVVREYIRTGEPVGSRTLLTRTRFPWSSATVRLEYATLEGDGYLAHPHTSAGRIPTTSGFRYYVDHCLAPRKRATVSLAFRTVARAEDAAHGVQITRALAHSLAQLSGTLAVVIMQDAAAHEAGLGNVLRMREFAEHRAVADLERVVDTIFDAPRALEELSFETPKVFINGENPVVYSESTSMVVAASHVPSGEAFVAALVGPLRMEYDRHWSILESLQSALGGEEEPRS